MSVCTAARNNACAHYGHRAAVGAPFPVRRPCTRKRENVMVKFILKRIGTMIIAMFMIILITFTLMHSIPGGPFTNTKGVPEEVTQAMEAKYGLDQPMPVQFVKYLGNLLHGDFGPSYKYTGKTVNDVDRMEFQTEEFYVKSTDEMYDLFSMVPEACENTAKIAEQCNFDFVFGDTKLPYFKAPDGMENQEYFEKLCYEGLERRYPGKVTDALRERLEYEIGVVKKMGYTNYYLIVYDFINYAKSRDIPVGPGRGSGAGSLAAYCVGITDIDPIRYSLIFERFLNPERVSMPDFDVDFCYERRQEVIDYVNRKYGRDHVAQIVTFGTMAARAAVRDVGRVMGMPYQDVDKVAKLIPTELKMTLNHALEVSPDLKAMYDAEPQVHELIDTSLKVEGMPRHASTHAAGVVITREPATEYVPLSTNDGLPVTQFNMVEIERLGLLKMDFLGLRTLTVISKAKANIKKNFGIDIKEEEIPFDDPEIFKLMGSGHTAGVFQVESAGMTATIKNMKPTEYKLSLIHI